MTSRLVKILTVAWLVAACGTEKILVAQNLPDATRVQKNIIYGTVDGKSLLLDVYYPAAQVPPATPATPPDAAPAGPVIVRIAPRREHPSGPATELLGKGYTLVYAAYLTEPDPSTSASAKMEKQVFNRFPADVQAAKAAIRWVHGNAAKLGIDRQRVGIWGAGHGASIAALLAVTPDRKDLNGNLGEFTAQSSEVHAVCLFEGTTDWRNAELYGDENVNMQGSPAYQLFGGNPKEHPEDARAASAVNYIRPTSPPTLMVTLASDEQRAMHLIYAETLRRAGVLSALYEEPMTGGAATRNVDETRLNRTVVAFFEDTLRRDRGKAPKLTLDQEVDQLAAAGLYKQARRLIEEQISLAGNAAGSDAAALPQRVPWLRKLRQINDKQQEPALRQLLEAKKAGKGAITEGIGAMQGVRTIWTIREVLTDPERIGQYMVEATVPQRIYETRADAMKFVDTLNNYIMKGDAPAAERQAGLLREMARKGDSDPAILSEFLARYAEVRGKTTHVWPPGLRGVAYASNYGQDLYGFWMDIKSGGIAHRLRYVAPPASGRYTIGSGKEEWGRLPGEPLLEQVEITRGFWLGESEVTQALWEGVLGRDENHSAFKSETEVRLKLPVENVSYAHAVNFLNKLGVSARLPTEVEWEYACRATSAAGGTNFMYGGTGRLSDMGWFWDEARQGGGNPASPTLNANGEIDVRILYELETDLTDMARLTHPVKQKLPNRWGLYDMQGNVWEWCAGSSPDKPRDYHPARGGSWISIPQSCRAARDIWFPVEEQSWNLGFRICITAE